MHFETGHIYHLYNRSINKELLFTSRENYLFFLKKIHENIKPYADIYAWCLMPNHFHLMIEVNNIEYTKFFEVGYSKEITLNNSIGILLSSYTHAINKSLKRKGSLFQQHTKAVCMTKAKTISPVWFNSFDGALINRSIAEKEYPSVCFSYIHNNPVNARLVRKASEWEFSSYRDYFMNRKGTLVNIEKGRRFIIP